MIPAKPIETKSLDRAVKFSTALLPCAGIESHHRDLPALVDDRERRLGRSVGACEKFLPYRTTQRTKDEVVQLLTFRGLGNGAVLSARSDADTYPHERLARKRSLERQHTIVATGSTIECDPHDPLWQIDVIMQYDHVRKVIHPLSEWSH